MARSFLVFKPVFTKKRWNTGGHWAGYRGELPVSCRLSLVTMLLLNGRVILKFLQHQQGLLHSIHSTAVKTLFLFFLLLSCLPWSSLPTSSREILQNLIENVINFLFLYGHWLCILNRLVSSFVHRWKLDRFYGVRAQCSSWRIIRELHFSFSFSSSF